MSDEQAVRDAIATWLAASMDGDVQTLADMLDDDVLFTVAGRPPFGKTAFLAGSSGKPYRFESKVDVLEVVLHGDWVLTRVQLDIDFAPSEAATPVRLCGPAMSVWRRSPTGRWLIWRDANLVAPLA